MKNVLPVALSFAALVACERPVKNQITEENYRKADSTLWAEYAHDAAILFALMDSLPEKTDSLRNAYRELNETSSERNRALAKQYAAVPGGLRRVYMTRMDFGKDTLEAILSRIPDSMRNSDYGKWIRWHIETEQLKEGDKYVKYDCRTADGEAFDWDALAGRNVLLLYGGLGCMGESGRNYIAELLKNTDRKDFGIVVHWPVANREELKETAAAFDLDVITVSDFKEEGSPIQVVYGSQATPTCYLIGRDGVIRVKSVGLNPRRFDEALKADGTLQ